MVARRILVWAGLLGLAAVSTFAVQTAAKSPSTDWPQFRGANRDGLSAETGLLDSWPESGPKEVWRVPLGEGYSGISVVGDRLYTMFSAEDDDGKPMQFAGAFDVKTGKEIWRTTMSEGVDAGFGTGPQSTPAVDGDQVFVLDTLGQMAALSTKNGAEKWGLSLTEEFGSKKPGFGFATSALVDGNQVIIEGGGSDGKAYAALDKKSGEVKWTFGDPSQKSPGYNSPIALDMNGERRYVYLLGDKMICIDSEGNEVWSHPWTYPGETYASPIFIPPNKIFASGAGDVGGLLLSVQEKGGTASTEEVWKTRFMRNHFSSSVVHDGYIYGFDNATLRAISVEDGETTWAKRGLGKGTLIYADGHLVVLSDQGALLLLEATPDAYTESGRVQALEGRCWTAPTLANGRLYVRNNDEMVAYDVRR